MAGDVAVPEFSSVGDAYAWVIAQRAITEATPYHNILNASDCDVDGYARIRDLMLVMQTLRDGGPRSLLADAGSEGEDAAASSAVTYVDVNADNYLSIGDALRVVQTLRGEGEPGDIAMIRPTFGTGATEGGSLTVGDTFQVQVLVDDLRTDDPNPNTPSDDRGIVTGSTDVTFNDALAGAQVPTFAANEAALPFFAPNYNTLPQVRVLDNAVRVHSTFDVVKLAQGQEIGADEQLFATVPFKVGAVNDFPTVAEDSSNNTIDVLGNDSSASGALQFATTFITDTTAFPVNVFGVNGPLPESDIMFGTTNVNVTVPGAPTLTNVTTPSHGTATIQGGAISYTPTGNFAGTDTFTYTVSYPGGVTDTATVSVTVTNVADNPNAVDDQLGPTNANVTLNVPAPGVLGNDTDPDVDPDGNPQTPALDSLTVTAVNGDTAAVGQSVLLPSGASVTVSANGAVVYNPTAVAAFQALGAGQTATDTFAYTVSDRLVQGNRRSDTANVTVTITGVNDAPNAVNDNYETALDTPLTVNAATGVLSNDTDPDAGDTLTATVLNDVDNGTLDLNPDGSFTYTPDAGFEGTDTFTYTVTDGTSTDTATVTIEVIGQPLRAINDTVQVDEGTGIGADPDENINAGGAITADDQRSTNPNFPPRIVAIQGVDVSTTMTFQTDEGGTITFDVNQANSFDNLVILYQAPSADFVGPDTFTYTIDDDDPESTRTSTATVTINVVNTDNDPTNAVNDTITPATPANVVLSVPAANVQVNGVANGNILNNDTDPDQLPLSAVAGTFTSAGGAVVVINANGSFTYDPRNVAAFGALGAGQTATDTFTYQTDDRGDHDTATVTVTVAGVNDIPAAATGTLTTDEDTVGTTLSNNSNNLSSLVTDPDLNEVLTFTAGTTTTAAGATVTINANGTFSYDPRGSATLQALAVGESANDSFTYTVRDASNQQATGTVNVTVNGVNDNPVAVDDEFTLDQENGVFQTLDVLQNDTDVDASDTLTIQSVTQGSNGGTVQVSQDGLSILYQHANGFDGTETFTYTVSDGNGGTDTATVTVNIVAFVPSTITGFVYVDKDNDGVKDSFDIGLANVPVTISGNDFNGNPIADSIDPTTLTDANGQYTFTDVPPSDANGYKITVGEVPFMVDGLETASNDDDTSTLGGAAPAGFSSMVSGNNQIMITIPELGDVVTINNNFGVRGLDPTFVSLADIIAQGDFTGSGLAAIGPNGVGFVVAPRSAAWAEFSNPMVSVSPDGNTATITATRNGQPVSSTVPVDTPLNGNGDKVRIIGTDNAGNVLVSFSGSPSAYNFTPAPEPEADEFAQAADAIFAEGFDG